MVPKAQGTRQPKTWIDLFIYKFSPRMNLLVGRNVPATLSPKRIIRGPRLLHLPFRTTSKYKTEVVLEGEGEGTARSGQSWGGSCGGALAVGPGGQSPRSDDRPSSFIKIVAASKAAPRKGLRLEPP